MNNGENQEFQVPKMEVLNQKRLFILGVRVFPYINLTYSLYKGEYLHFRYLKRLVNGVFFFFLWGGFHQKWNGTEYQRTPNSVSCDRAIRYSGFFPGSVGPLGPTVGDFLDCLNICWSPHFIELMMGRDGVVQYRDELNQSGQSGANGRELFGTGGIHQIPSQKGT